MPKAAIACFIFGLILNFVGCANSARNERSHPADGKTDGGQSNIAASTTQFKETEFKEVAWKDGSFVLKFPCSISKDDSGVDYSIAQTNEDIQKCKVGILMFIVSSKKSKKSLTDEYKQFVTETKLSSSKVNDLDYAENWKITINQIGDPPNQKTVNVSSTKTRLFKVNDKWLIKLEVICSSPTESDCKNLFIDSSGKRLSEFFDSIKINK